MTESKDVFVREGKVTNLIDVLIFFASSMLVGDGGANFSI